MSAQLLAERVSDMIPRYEEMFAGRGDVTPTDPLEFHLYHLARYWSRLIGFCRQTPSKPEGWIDGDLGACVQVGSEFAQRLIAPDSPIYRLWQDYWAQTQSVLHKRPVSIDAVEAASRAFDACVVELKYDPWGYKSVETNRRPACPCDAERRIERTWCGPRWPSPAVAHLFRWALSSCYE